MGRCCIGFGNLGVGRGRHSSLAVGKNQRSDWAIER